MDGETVGQSLDASFWLGKLPRARREANDKTDLPTIARTIPGHQLPTFQPRLENMLMLSMVMEMMRPNSAGSNSLHPAALTS